MINKIYLLCIIYYLLISFTGFCTNCNCKILINAVGDIMLGSKTPKERLPTADEMMKASLIGSYLKNADIVFGNLEGVFITDGIEPVKCTEEARKASRCYEFGMPEIFSSFLKSLHFTTLSIDNNHTDDYGEPGYVYTQILLSDLGIKYVPKAGYATYSINNTSIAFVAFGFTKNSYHIAEVEIAQRVIRKLNKDYSIIIVSFHGGAEGKDALHVSNKTEMFYNEDRGNLVKFSHAVIDEGADLIIGHGPHVLRAIEIYKNKLIMYSLGNFFTYGQFNLKEYQGIGAIMKVELNEKNGNFIKGNITPTIQVGWGIPIYDKQKRAIFIIQNLSHQDFPDSNIKINQNGLFFIK